MYAGTVAFALAASVLLASPIAVARYFYVALPPLLLAISIVAAKLLGVRAIACGCAALIAVGLYGQAVFVVAGYSQLNNEPIDYLEAVAHTYDNDGEPTVISSNIMCAGTYAVMCDDVPQTFIAPDTGIGRAYRVYAPVMSFAAHVEEVLSAPGDLLWCLMKTMRRKTTYTRSRRLQMTSWRPVHLRWLREGRSIVRTSGTTIRLPCLSACNDTWLWPRLQPCSPPFSVGNAEALHVGRGAVDSRTGRRANAAAYRVRMVVEYWEKVSGR